jgi:hypothetical protein
MMARHFRTTDAEAKVLEARLKSIGKLTVMGGALAMAGSYGLGLFKKPIEEATEYERRLAALRQMGLGDAQIADAQKFAEANRIIGTSLNDRMRLFVDAQGSFRQSGMSGAAATAAAKTMTPIMAQYEVATKMLSGDGQAAAEGSMRNLSKIVEMMGGLSDTNRAKAIADGVFKAAQSSGRMVDERQLKQFVAYGSSATNQLSLRTIFGGLEPIIGEMGGSTTGVGLRTGYNRVNGMLALMPKRTQEELRRLGMADGSGKRQTDDLARMQATDTIGYVQEVMRRYEKARIKTQVDRERENAILFGTNGAKIFNKLMSQMPVILESLKAYDRRTGRRKPRTTRRARRSKPTWIWRQRRATSSCASARSFCPTTFGRLKWQRQCWSASMPSPRATRPRSRPSSVCSPLFRPQRLWAARCRSWWRASGRSAFWPGHCV